MLNFKRLKVALVHMFRGVFQLSLEGSFHLAPRNLAQAVRKHLQMQLLMFFPFPVFICFEFDLCFLIIYCIKKISFILRGSILHFQFHTLSTVNIHIQKEKKSWEILNEHVLITHQQKKHVCMCVCLKKRVVFTQCVGVWLV